MVYSQEILQFNGLFARNAQFNGLFARNTQFNGLFARNTQFDSFSEDIMSVPSSVEDLRFVEEELPLLDTQLVNFIFNRFYTLFELRT